MASLDSAPRPWWRSGRSYQTAKDGRNRFGAAEGTIVDRHTQRFLCVPVDITHPRGPMVAMVARLQDGPGRFGDSGSCPVQFCIERIAGALCLSYPRTAMLSAQSHTERSLLGYRCPTGR